MWICRNRTGPPPPEIPPTRCRDRSVAVPRRSGRRRSRSALQARATRVASPREARRLSFSHPVAASVEPAKNNIEQYAEHADRDHADQYEIGAQHFHAVGNQVAEPGASRDQLGGNDGGPAGAKGDTQADDDLRQRSRQHDFAEQRGIVRTAENAAGMNEHRIDAFGTGDGVEQNWKEGADENDKNLAALVDSEPQYG